MFKPLYNIITSVYPFSDNKTPKNITFLLEQKRIITMSRSILLWPNFLSQIFFSKVLFIGV